MKKFLVPIILVAVFVLGMVWYYSDKKVVLRKSDTFIECFQKEGGKNILSQALGESKFRNLLAEEVSLDFQHPDMPDIKGGIKHNRNKLSEAYLYVMKSAKEVQLSDQEMQMKEINDDTATVSITLNGKVDHRNYAMDSDLSIELQFLDSSEGWRISGIKVLNDQ